jgi:hypothetical protein
MPYSLLSFDDLSPYVAILRSVFTSVMCFIMIISLSFSATLRNDSYNLKRRRRHADLAQPRLPYRKTIP